MVIQVWEGSAVARDFAKLKLGDFSFVNFCKTLLFLQFAQATCICGLNQKCEMITMNSN